MITLANCTIGQLPMVQQRLHPARERSALIFAAGCLNNTRLVIGLGSQELSTYYDGMVASGRLSSNPYWPK
jgi:hypothetical protein